MREHDETQEDLARLLKVSSATVSKCFNNASPWTLDGMYTIMDHYHLNYRGLHKIFPPKGKNDIYDRCGECAEK